MELAFYGAAGEVTGSCYLLRTASARVLIDCGLFQGSAGDLVRNARALPFDARSLDAVIVTHAHLDHTGRLPRLVQDGFRGPVFCTRMTRPLTDLLLMDAAALQMADVQRRNRQRDRRGCPPGRFCEPLFTEGDVKTLLGLVRTAPMDKPVPVAPGIAATFVDSGHIIGSASVVLTASDGPRTRTVVFSGDVGNPGTPVIRDPVAPVVGHADAVVLESTYGDRDHKPLDATIDELCEVLHKAWADGGKVLIPAFSIGRTQTLIYDLARLHEAGRLPRGVQVYLDSPMGIEATRMYEADPSLYDDETRALVTAGQRPLSFPGLRMLRSGQESRSMNDHKGPAVIIAGAGMATGGRIVHHLARHLPDPRTHVLITGFQAYGTLGRRLVDKERRVRIMGLPVDVHAQVHTLGGFSAHGGSSTLIAWAREVLAQQKHPGERAPGFYLTHGEAKPRAALAEALRHDLRVPVHMPLLGDVVSL
jgi:metallo-beta-lactamase family protein